MNSKRIKIAVSGVGGGVGQSIIKALSKTSYSIIGLDGEILAAGAYCVSKSYQIPYAKNKDFIPRLLEICKKEKCRLLFPGLDAELPFFAANIKKFEAIGTRVVISSPNVVEISDNKLLTYSILKKAGILVPLTVDLREYIKNKKKSFSGFPIILKPKKGGARSKNVIKIISQDHLQAFLHMNDCKNYIVQEYIEGDEYTCGTVTLSGKHIGTIIMRRILRDGDTYKAFVEKNTAIDKEISKVIELIKPVGALNVQLRLKDGNPYIFELNARCSGTTAARAMAGFNEPKIIADYFLLQKQPKYKIKQISILRYWKEMAVENDKIESFKNNTVIANSKFKPL
jgi:carbamoyl-phosphate synthase large subunit